MPRSRSPHRYPTICFRIAALLEERTEDFSLSFSTQREALDTRQMLYSFSNAARRESERLLKLKSLEESKRWKDIFISFGKWSLSLDPPYNKEFPLQLDRPAVFHFQLRDNLPQYAQLEDQLQALENKTPDPTGLSSADITDVLSQLGIAPSPSKD